MRQFLSSLDICNLIINIFKLHNVFLTHIFEEYIIHRDYTIDKYLFSVESSSASYR